MCFLPPACRGTQCAPGFWPQWCQAACTPRRTVVRKHGIPLQSLWWKIWPIASQWCSGVALKIQSYVIVTYLCYLLSKAPKVCYFLVEPTFIPKQGTWPNILLHTYWSKRWLALCAQTDVPADWSYQQVDLPLLQWTGFWLQFIIYS